VLACATALTIVGLRDSLVFFVTPTELVATQPAHKVRIGGMVEDDSVIQAPNAVVTFRLTDFETTVLVQYQGVLPDLFREGQGVVVQGIFKDGAFVASEILAKHDENYMPEEVKDMLEKQNRVE